MSFSLNLSGRLVQTKQIFTHGQAYTSRADDLNRLFAILSIDHAIESFLHTVVTELGGSFKNSDYVSFKELFNVANTQTNALRGKPLKLAKEVSDIRSLRNNAQHNGHIPSESSLNRAIVYGEDFLRHSFDLCFDKNYDEIFLADVIKNSEVMGHFKEAEKALSEERLEDVPPALGKCFYLFRKDFEDKRQREEKRFDVFGMEFSAEGVLDNNYREAKLEHSIRAALQPIIERLNAVIEELDIIAIGARLDEYELFRKFVPFVNQTGDGKFYCGYGYQKLEANKSNCLRSLNFLYNLIIKSQ